jgi:calcineurin-like phosphoesterase family protein
MNMYEILKSIDEEMFVISDTHLGYTHSNISCSHISINVSLEQIGFKPKN